LWHLQSGELLGTFTGHANTVTALSFTASGEMLVSGSLDKTIKIWQRS
jgi:WD40 repeat protein